MSLYNNFFQQKPVILTDLMDNVELMKYMGWSYQELMATPISYLRIIRLRRKAESDAIQRESDKIKAEQEKIKNQRHGRR